MEAGHVRFYLAPKVIKHPPLHTMDEANVGIRLATRSKRELFDYIADFSISRVIFIWCSINLGLGLFSATGFFFACKRLSYTKLVLLINGMDIRIVDMFH